MRYLLLLFAIFPLRAMAEPVLQVKGSNFLFQAGSFQAGDSLTILGPDGQPKGTARVKQAGKNQSVGEVMSGQIAPGDQVSVGDPNMTPPLPPQLRPRPPPTSTATKFQFSVGLSYPLVTTGKFAGQLSDFPATAEGKSGSSVILTADFRHWFNDSYGLFYGLDYELDRVLDNGLKYTIEGAPATNTNTDKYSNLLVHVSFVFRYANVYVPVGLNYSTITYTTIGKGAVSGGLGYQLAVGTSVWRNLTVELTYRAHNMKIKVDYPNLESLNFSTATISELLLTARWVF